MRFGGGSLLLMSGRVVVILIVRMMRSNGEWDEGGGRGESSCTIQGEHSAGEGDLRKEVMPRSDSY